MRKTMKKEVTKTKVTLAKMVMEDGRPKAEPMQDEILIGNVSLEKAQKEMDKRHEDRVTVFTVEPETVTYEMSVEDFIQVAQIVEPQSEEAPQEV